MRDRDDFTKPIKRKLADRVAWRCSFPGCGRITIGPGHKNSSDVINLGEAAHIHAASKNGPRPNPELSSEDIKSIDNGIWMCRQHAKIIDSDYTQYSATTLRQWKAQAEEYTYQQIKELARPINIPLTLVSLGRNIIFDGIWNSVNNNKWGFEIWDFVIGDIELLKEFSVEADADKYIIIESQGDGRLLEGQFTWQYLNDKYKIEVFVKAKQEREDPNNLGGDIALGEDGDLIFEGGDVKIITGIDFAKQLISNNLSLGFGELLLQPTLGSHFSKYFWAYKNNVMLLNRLLKIEITRLVSIPTFGYDSPPLNFINRIIDVEILSTEINKNRIPVNLKLEWGNGEIWENRIKIYIHKEGVNESEISDN